MVAGGRPLPVVREEDEAQMRAAQMRVDKRAEHLARTPAERVAFHVVGILLHALGGAILAALLVGVLLGVIAGVRLFFRWL